MQANSVELFSGTFSFNMKVTKCTEVIDRDTAIYNVRCFFSGIFTLWWPYLLDQLGNFDNNKCNDTN